MQLLLLCVLFRLVSSRLVSSCLYYLSRPGPEEFASASPQGALSLNQLTPLPWGRRLSPSPSPSPLPLPSLPDSCSSRTGPDRTGQDRTGQPSPLHIWIALSSSAQHAALVCPVTHQRPSHPSMDFAKHHQALVDSPPGRFSKKMLRLFSP